MSSDEEFKFVWAMIYYPLVVLMFFINCFADAEPQFRFGYSKSDVTTPPLESYSKNNFD